MSVRRKRTTVNIDDVRQKLRECVVCPDLDVRQLRRLVAEIPDDLLWGTLEEAVSVIPRDELPRVYIACARYASRRVTATDISASDKLFCCAVNAVFDAPLSASHMAVFKTIGKHLPDRLVTVALNRVVEHPQHPAFPVAIKSLIPRLGPTDLERVHSAMNYLLSEDPYNRPIKLLNRRLNLRRAQLEGGESAGAMEQSRSAMEQSRSAMEQSRSAMEESLVALEVDSTAQLSSAPTSERVVSTGFSGAGTASTPIAVTTPLQPETDYYFWLEVGAPVPGAIDEEPADLPVDLLPEDAILTVALFTTSDMFIASVRVGYLMMNMDGSFSVHKKADIPADMDPNDELLRRRLFFTVRTPPEERQYRLRCSIFFRGVVVQSREVRTWVSRDPDIPQPALATRLDYTINRRLTAASLQHIKQHRLSIMMNEDDSDGHDFYFHGDEDYQEAIHVDGQGVQNLITTARRALRRASWGSDEPWDKEKRYKYKTAATVQRLLPDLHRLAQAGRRAYDVLADRIGKGPAGADRLAELMRTPGYVQLALKESVRFVPPLAMFYDYQFDPALSIEQTTLCPKFVTALAGDDPLDKHDCFNGRCPSASKNSVVCPSGFWGFRHDIGIPVTIGAGRYSPATVPVALKYSVAPRMVIGVCTDQQFKMRDKHVSAVQKLVPAGYCQYADTRQMTLERMKDASAHIVYFYCHGGVVDTVPFIQVGPLTDTHIERANLRGEHIYWTDPRPLVFVNGCHTTSLEPEVAIELVSGFVETAGASAVVGTEITVFEPLAVSFANEFFKQFLSEHLPLGVSIRLARLRLLKDLNPLGLVYIPYGLSSLYLNQAPA